LQLSPYLRLLRAHWLAIVISTVLGLALSIGWVFTQPAVYTADATAILTTGVSGDLGSALVGDNYAKSRVKSYLNVAESRTVADYAAKTLKLSSSPETLVSDVTVSNPLDTAVLAISAKGSTPKAARDLAETWIAGMIQQVNNLENAGGEKVTDPDTGKEVVSIVKLRTLDTAVLPSNPSSPNVKLALAIGILLGLIAGIFYVMIRRNLDRKIRSVESVENAFTLAVVGTVPFDRNFNDTERLLSLSSSRSRARHSDDDAVAESMRELRSNLQYMDVDNPPRIIVITSSLPGDGKSTVAVNLAVTIAAGGQRVIIIDGDLRRPTVAKSFNLLEGVGLTDVLVGRAAIEDVLQPWGDSGNLLVMGSGSVPPNPSELLGSKTMSTLINELATKAIVIIDAPPLIPVTDAAVLTAISHGALVVASVGKTTVDALSKALGNIERVNGRALGIILNRVPRRGPGSAYYGYQYTGQYVADSKEKTPQPITGQQLSLDFDNIFDPKNA
jgi:capsular exopolysaccharide synthesis family protein